MVVPVGAAGSVNEFCVVGLARVDPVGVDPVGVGPAGADFVGVGLVGVGPVGVDPVAFDFLFNAIAMKTAQTCQKHGYSHRKWQNTKECIYV